MRGAEGRRRAAARALALGIAGAALVRLVLFAQEAAREPEPAFEAVQLDPNHASPDALALLPGLGPARARAIVEAREGGARWTELDQLGAVHGIGPATLQALRPHLVFGAIEETVDATGEGPP